MNNTFTRGIARATELTKVGKLNEATALIQSLVQDRSAADHQPAAADPPANADVIEGTYTSLDDTGPGPTPRADRTAARKPRTGLRETLRRIAAGGMPQGGVLTPVPIDLPDGAQFLSVNHTGLRGSRDYRLYIPAKRPEGLMPLILMLHGCTQAPEDFAIGTGMNALAEEFGCLIAYPAQPHQANTQKCWNWFRPEDQAKGRGEPALIAGIVADILRDHPADPARVYAAGLSAGGAAAAILGAAYPDLFAAVGVHSGLPVGAAQDVPTAFAAMSGGASGKALSCAMPTIVFHGLADSTVHPSNGAVITAQALQTQADLKRVRRSGAANGGRNFRQTRHEDASGRSIIEQWEIEGAGHEWAGGHAGGSYTDPQGPDASRKMLQFFLQHRRA